jgi:hypothetical protein
MNDQVKTNVLSQELSLISWMPYFANFRNYSSISYFQEYYHT